MSLSADLTITVDTAGIADVPALSLLSTACLVNNKTHIAPPEVLVRYIEQEHSPRFFAERLAGRRCLIRVARLDCGGLVGYMMIDPAALIVTEDALELEVKRLHVLPGYRGLRVGARLFDFAYGDARTLGARRIIIGCEPDDHHNRTLYERRGFVLAGERVVTISTINYTEVLYARALD
ncbi:MAG: hypothetical protein A4S16_00045 [Proteobacteria bacterium SG_bin6]|nr:MAG: hypothetical protein A4S16_00045 [Proteobacteria bacterium SG_bin6]